ncbi:hypothetical protein [Flavobacterium terrisoli]|uniref:hypothetical protein n=1 Tax=Flavobacterium terrisoli TaxID=3242195 RepID=UPI0025427B21|nr:hypothetical protein [Flavobacterium buctense]
MKKIVSAILGIALIACNHKENSSNQIPDINGSEIQIDSATVDTTTSNVGLNSFDEFPEEIDGPGCFFAIDEKDYDDGHYVYADNADSICYIKMNDEFIRFELAERKRDTTFNTYIRKFKSDDYQLSVDVKKVKEVGEAYFFKGSMFIKHKDEPAVEKELYGVCGC